MLTRSKSGKALAIVSGRLTIQCAASTDDPTQSSLTPAALEAAIAPTYLRRLSPVLPPRRLSTGVFQLECLVEYGPVMGAYESDLKRAAERVARPDDRVEIFGCTRKALTEMDVKAMREGLDAMEDLGERKRVEKLLAAVQS